VKDILKAILDTPAFAEGIAWQRKRFNAGDAIVKKGNIGRTFFLMDEGVVRVLGEAELDGNKKISPGLCDLGKDACFGELSLFGMEQRIATIVAVTEVSLIEIDSEHMLMYLDEHPDEGYFLLKAILGVLVRRLEIANDRIGKLLAWGIKVHDIDKHL